MTLEDQRQIEQLVAESAARREAGQMALEDLRRAEQLAAENAARLDAQRAQQ